MVLRRELPGRANFLVGKGADFITRLLHAILPASVSRVSEELFYVLGLPPFLHTGAYGKVTCFL